MIDPTNRSHPISVVQSLVIMRISALVVASQRVLIECNGAQSVQLGKGDGCVVGLSNWARECLPEMLTRPSDNVGTIGF